MTKSVVPEVPAKKSANKAKTVAKKPVKAAKKVQYEFDEEEIVDDLPNGTYVDQFGQIVNANDEPTPQLNHSYKPSKQTLASSRADEPEEDPLPLVVIQVNIKDCEPEDADKLVKIVFDKLKSFDLHEQFEARYSVKVSPY